MKPINSRLPIETKQEAGPKMLQIVFNLALPDDISDPRQWEHGATYRLEVQEGMGAMLVKVEG